MQERLKAGASLALLAVLLIVALLAVTVTPGDVLAQARERFQWVISDKLTVLEGGAVFNSDVTITDDLGVTGDLSVDDLTVGGYIQGDGIYVANTSGNTLITGTLDVDGAVTLNSTADVDGNISSGTGAITMTDNVMVDGQADAVQLSVQGYTTQTNSLLVVESSDGTDLVFVDGSGNMAIEGHRFDLDANNDTSIRADTNDQIDIEIGGQDMISYTQPAAYYLTPVYLRFGVVDKTASYSPTKQESGGLFTNAGASGEITYTLPAATNGLGYCFYVYAAQTMTLELDDADQFHHLTNAAGDRLQNAGTAGDSICVYAKDGTYWVPMQEIGTWSDAN